MLIFGSHTCLIPRDNMIVFNLTSYMEGFDRVDILPPYQINHVDREFDIQYANYLMNDDYKFIQFMKIMMSLYIGKDVYVMIEHTEMNDLICESVQKLIQQKYGVLSNNIYSLDDWDYLVESSFSLNGVYNLDKDKERYTYLTLTENECREYLSSL